MHAKPAPDRQAAISFLSGNIPRAMLAFVGPLMLGILVQNLYGAVDLFVVGHYATTADVSAVTIGSQLMSIATQLVIGFATGITVLTGRYYGAKEPDCLAHTVGAAILLFGAAAVVLTAVYLRFHRAMAAAMQTPPEAMQATLGYLAVCSIGILFVTGYNVVTSILTGLGDSKTPFLFILVACMINVVFDVVFVSQFHLGALGAAIATSMAQAGSFLFSILFLRHKGLGFPFTWKHLHSCQNRVQIKQTLKIGGPVAVQNVMVGVSFLFITAIVNRMGLTASAAVGVVEKLIIFFFVPATALSTAVGSASAQNLGAQDFLRARKCMWWGIVMALTPSSVIALSCQFFGEQFTGLLNSDPAVVSMAAGYLHTYIVDILMVSFVFCMNGYFNSCGKSWFSLAHSLITTFAVRIPSAYLISRLPHTSLTLMGWSAPLSTFVSLILCLAFLSRLDPSKTPLAGPAH